MSKVRQKIRIWEVKPKLATVLASKDGERGQVYHQRKLKLQKFGKIF